MPRITRTSTLAAVAGAAAVALAGFGANAALAESTPTPSPSSSTSTQQPGTDAPGAAGANGAPGGRVGRGHGPGGMKGADGAALASALGLDEAKVEAGITKVREANRPTQKPGEGTAPTRADREARRTAYIAALAKELGVSESKVTAALDKVRSDREAEHRTAMSERLDAAVKDGKLTDADKASVLKAFDTGVLGGGPR